MSGSVSMKQELLSNVRKKRPSNTSWGIGPLADGGELEQYVSL